MTSVQIKWEFPGAAAAKKALTDINQGFKDVGTAAKDAAKKMDGFKEAGEWMQSFGKKLTLGVTLPLVGIGTAAVKMAGDLEQSKIAFTTLLGSAEKADKFIKSLFQFAKETPFEFTGLQEAAKRMLAFGFQAEQIIPMLTAIGNAAAGLGGSSELINRITLAIGQMQAKGKISAQEMMQLAEAGIPAWEILANKIGVTIPEAMKMAEKGAISASVGVTALIEGMSAKFGGLMEQQSTTLLGLFSTLKDSVSQSLTLLGADIIETFDLKNKLKSAIEWVDSMVKWFTSLDAGTKKLIITVGAFAAVIGPLAVGIGLVVTVVTSAAAGLAALGVLLSGPVGLAIAGLTIGISAGIAIWKNWNSIVATFKETADSVKKSITDMVDKIKAQIVDRFEQIVQSVREKINKVKDFFRDLYDAVVGHSYIPDMVKEIAYHMGEGLQRGMVDNTRSATRKVADLFDQVGRTVKRGLGDAVANALVYGDNIRESVLNLGKQIVAGIISGFVQIGIAYALQHSAMQLFAISNPIIQPVIPATAPGIPAAGVPMGPEAGVIGGAIALGYYINSQPEGSASRERFGEMIGFGSDGPSIGTASYIEWVKLNRLAVEQGRSPEEVYNEWDAAGRPALERGGIVTRDGIYRMGEGNKREAVIPLESSEGQRQLAGMGGRVEIHNHYHGNFIADEIALHKHARKMRDIIRRENQRYA